MKDISDTVFKRIDPNLLRKLSWKKATAMVVCKEEKGKPFAKKEGCFQSPLKHALHETQHGKGFVLLRCFEMVPTLPLLIALTSKM